MVFTVVGLVLLSLLAESTGLGYVITCLVLLGFGFALFSSPNVSAIMGGVEEQYYGVASGMVGTMRLFGQMLSMGVAMLLFSVFIGRVEITPEHYGGFLQSVKTSFLISPMLCLVGVFFSLARGKVRSDVALSTPRDG